MTRRLARLAVVGLMALLAGCAASEPEATSSPAFEPTPRATSTATIDPTARPTPTAAVAPTSDVAPFHAIPVDAVFVSGTEDCHFTPGPEDGAGAGWVAECQLDMSDPRVSGSERQAGFRFIVESEQPSGLVWVADDFSLTNAEGAWHGTGQGTDDWDVGALLEAHYVGEGAYGGLQFHYYLGDQRDGPTRVLGWIAPTPAGTAANRVVCGQSLRAGRTTVTCEGLSFDVSLSDPCLTGSCGLVVDLPGGVGSGEDAEANTGMAASGNAAGYVVVQPDTPGNGWDYPVDSGRIRSFLDQLIVSLDLDRNRVHIGGHSAGGYMAWVFVCDHADLIASAAPLGAGASREEMPSCDFDVPGHPAAEVDILLAHGRSDGVVPFSTALAQRDLVVAAWSMTESDVIADEPGYRWTRWTSPGGTVFELLEFDWSGGMLGAHCYPGITGEVGCGADTPVHYGQAALDFYLAHPKDG